MNAYGAALYGATSRMMRALYKPAPSASGGSSGHAKAISYAVMAQKVYDALAGLAGKRRTSCMRLGNYEGCKMYFRPLIMSEVIMMSGLQEVYVKKVLDLKPDDVFVDVGAHIGTYTIPTAKKVSRVISFEPNPESFKLLKKNVEVNSLQNVTIHNQAVGAKAETLTFNMSEDPACSGFGIEYKIIDRVPVDCVPLDEALASEPRITWLKIDVEGNEINAVSGALQSIKKHHPKMLIEIGEHRVSAIRQLLEPLGYSMQRIYGAQWMAT